TNEVGKGLHVVGYLDNICQETKNGVPILGKLDQIRDVVAKYKVDEVIFALPVEQYKKANQLILKVDDIP
ncbi:MAG: hypothetical protein GWN62_25625, partial [Aliifodinibius sp.]|nr:hypothetical protein [Fodinibius sp.]